MNKLKRVSTLLLMFCLGCMSLEMFYYKNGPVDEYLRTEDLAENQHYRGIIPDSLIVPDSFVVDGDTCYAFWALRPDDLDTILLLDSNALTVLYSHGNLASINDYWDRVELLWEMGFRVYIYDYPGFGRSQGSPTSATCYACSEYAADQVRYSPYMDSARFVLYGYSLGAFMSTHLAADIWDVSKFTPAAIILESATASSGALLKSSGLLDLPGELVSADDYSNTERIGNVECPILLMHGKNDEYIIFEHHALPIWDAAVEPKDSLWIEGAGHGDVPYYDSDLYRGKILDFLQTHLAWSAEE